MAEIGERLRRICSKIRFLIAGRRESLKPEGGLLPEILIGISVLHPGQKRGRLGPVDRMAGSE